MTTGEVALIRCDNFIFDETFYAEGLAECSQLIPLLWFKSRGRPRHASAGHGSANISDFDNFSAHRFLTQLNIFLRHFAKSSRCVFKGAHMLLMIASEVHMGNFVSVATRRHFGS